MSRLSPESPGRHAAPMIGEGETVPTGDRIVLHSQQSCDRCGYSTIDGKPIAKAGFQVEIKRRKLYFCAHHYHAYSWAFMLKNYPVRELA